MLRSLKRVDELCSQRIAVDFTILMRLSQIPKSPFHIKQKLSDLSIVLTKGMRMDGVIFDCCG